eukprot:jgi/Bigna1/84600/fgenesh1_pg.169_\
MMWLWHGLWGVTINLSLFLLLYVLNKVCGALRSQPSGSGSPPKQEELFNITNVGSSKWTISSELGARDFFLASAGGPPAGCRVSTLPMVANGCRFRLIPFGGLPDGSPAHEGGADAYLDELPWTENSVLVVSIEVADGAMQGARLSVNPAGRARWTKRLKKTFRDEFTLTKVGANFTIKTHGRLLDANALGQKSRAWTPNYTAALYLLLQWVLAAKNFIMEAVSCRWLGNLLRMCF